MIFKGGYVRRLEREIETLKVEVHNLKIERDRWKGHYITLKNFIKKPTKA